MEEPPQLEGADKIVAWWGEWIDFHDFYLLNTPAPDCVNGELRIHGWVTDWDATDGQGYFKRSRECVVTIGLSHIRSMKISSEAIPAIIAELKIEHVPSGWTVSWDSSYGVEGTIEAAAVRIDLQPGRPQTSEEAG